LVKLPFEAQSYILKCSQQKEKVEVSEEEDRKNGFLDAVFGEIKKVKI